MKTLPLYLSRIFLTNMLVTSFAMVSILGVLDALNNRELLPPNAGLADQMWFMALRSPLLFERVFIFAFLLALLVTYVMLIRRNELVAIVSAGLSILGQIAALAPAVLFASLLSLLVIDQAAPRAQQMLIDWLGQDAGMRDPGSTDELWLSDRDTLVRIQSVSDQTLTGLTIIEREDEGSITSVSFAETAVAGTDGWQLSGVTQVRYDNQDIVPPATWQSPLTPETLRLLSLAPRYLSVTDLWDLSQLRDSGNRPKSAYEVWFYSRLALPIAALGFLIVTVSVMQTFERNAKPEMILACGMAGGIVYSVLDSITNSLPDVSAFDPAVAALMPVAALLLAGLFLALWHART